MEHFVAIIQSLREYFNDFVGAIVPGAALAAGLTIQLAGLVPTDAFSRYWAEWSWLPALAAMFAAGHTLLALHTTVMKAISRDRARRQVKSGQAFSHYEHFFQERLLGPSAAKSADFNALRNYAMSVSSAAAEIGRRFMFLALFCYGTATAAAVLTIIALIAPVLGHGVWGAQRLVIVLALAVAAWLLDDRGLSFEIRALGTPFAIACAELSENKREPRS